MPIVYRGLCAECAGDHRREGCEREHFPNTEGAHGGCLGDPCVRAGAPARPLPVLCIARPAGDSA